MLISEKTEGAISSKGYKSYEKQFVSTWHINNFSKLLYHKLAICILSKYQKCNKLMYQPILSMYELYDIPTFKTPYEINSLLLCSRFPDRLSQSGDNKLQRHTVQQLKKAVFRGSTSCPDMKYPTSKNLISVGYLKLHIRTETLIYVMF